MKRIVLGIMALTMLVGCQCKSKNDEKSSERPVVYMTQEISPEALLRVYHALGVTPQGRVAVKISTGEPGGHNYLNPKLIENLVHEVNGTIVECNTAYGGKRGTTEEHMQAARDHGFCDIAEVDIMDAEGEMRIPVRDTTYMKYNIVGDHLKRYDFMVNLAHFKGHTMGGFGGVLKNQSIGVASQNGKCYIHTTGHAETLEQFNQRLEEKGQDWVAITDSHDAFHECMANAAAAVADYMKGKIVYINVMNNLSVDCDCDSHPADPEMQNIGILASLDPVALDQACVDIVFNYPSEEGDDAAALIERINSRHGIHTIEHAAAIGLGSREYRLVLIDGEDMLARLDEENASCLVRNHGVTMVYHQSGVRDLYELLVGGNTLRGAVVADKIIGNAAASLMVLGGVREVWTHVICTPAKEKFEKAGIPIHYEEETEMIINRDKTAQCPLDARLNGTTTAEEALPIIKEFYHY